jgi:AcrR family transcriptional regulator
MGKRLGRDDWINEGLRTLAGHGVDAVRVERLAEALNVTKGSFYWHFADRSALLAAVLDAWKTRATGDVIDTVEARGRSVPARVRALMSIVFSVDGRLEQQIRAWASVDPAAEAAQAEIDRQRLGYVLMLLEAQGFDRDEAAARAQFAYHAMVGRFAMHAPEKADPVPGEQIDRICRMLLRKPAKSNRS